MEKACAITAVLNSLGKKWMLAILRALHVSGARRFNDMVRDMVISPRTLSKRLKELEKIGVVSRKRFSEIPPRVEYSLTRKGMELIRCFRNLDAWAKKFDKQ